MFTYLKRFFFFFLTNIAVLLLLSGVMIVVEYFYPGISSLYGGNMTLLIYAAVIGFGGSLISLWISRWSAKKMYNIVLIQKDSSSQDEKLRIVWETVERIAQINQIDMPEVGYYESSDPNAFATGASKNSSLVAVSTGLLDSMSNNEIEGVIGHEMAHILNGDMVTLTLIQGVLNTFVIVVSQLATRAITAFISKDDENETVGFFTYQAVYMLCQLIFGFLAMFVVMWFSRMREYRADLGGASYTSKSSMIAGLKKLQSITQKTQITGDKKMTAFMITEPDSFFSTHPALENRIAALESNYQIH